MQIIRFSQVVERAWIFLKALVRFRLYVIVWSFMVASLIYKNHHLNDANKPVVVEREHKAWFTDSDFVNEAIDLRLERGSIKFRLSTADVPNIASSGVDSCERKIGIIAREEMYKFAQRGSNLIVRITHERGPITFGELTVDGVKLSDLMVGASVAYPFGTIKKSSPENWCALLESYKSRLTSKGLPAAD